MFHGNPNRPTAAEVSEEIFRDISLELWEALQVVAALGMLQTWGTPNWMVYLKKTWGYLT